MACGALVSNLQAPSTTTDGLAHVLDILAEAGADGLPGTAVPAAALRDAHAGLRRCSAAGLGDARTGCGRWPRLRLNIADIVAKFTKALGTPVPGSGTATIPSTCSDYVSVSGNVPVVPGSGTSAYQGIAGTFAATLTVNDLHPTTCEPNSLLYHQLLWLNGAGEITRR